jgi:hypothetical protein
MLAGGRIAWKARRCWGCRVLLHRAALGARSMAGAVAQWHDASQDSSLAGA